MILIRCSACKKFYAIKNSECRYCGNKDKTKAYYVRVGNQDEYAGNSLAVAREIEAKRKLARKTAGIPEYKKSKALLFTDFANKHFMPHYENKNKRPEAIYPIVEYYKKRFEYKFLPELKLPDIESAMIDIAESNSERTGKKRSPQTRQHYLKTLRRMFNYAIECGFININPMNAVKNIKFDNKITRYLTAAEEKRLLDECRENRSPYLYKMVLIAINTGMRLSEIRALKKANIRDGNIYLTGDMTKNGEGRTIPIVNAIKHLFEGELELDLNHDVKKSYDVAVKKAGIEDFRFHDLRHTFASKLVQRGTDLYTVQVLMGHSDIELTQRYAHLAPDNIINAIKKLDD